MNASQVGLAGATPYERDGRRERTYAESHSPTADISPYVTRTRTYGFSPLATLTNQEPQP